MKLILASHVTPIIKALLKTLDPRTAAVTVVMNARDYHDPETFAAITKEKCTEFKDAGFASVEPLDLKAFFSQPKQLQTHLESQHPSVVCAVGGDVFLLMTAIKLSGFDQYLKSRQTDPNFFYCGSSAGAIVVSSNLQPYLMSDADRLRTLERYGAQPALKGLNLISDYIVPHLGERPFAADVRQMSQNLEALGANIRYISKNGTLTITPNHQQRS